MCLNMTINPRNLEILAEIGAKLFHKCGMSVWQSLCRKTHFSHQRGWETHPLPPGEEVEETSQIIVGNSTKENANLALNVTLWTDAHTVIHHPMVWILVPRKIHHLVWLQLRLAQLIKTINYKHSTFFMLWISFTSCNAVMSISLIITCRDILLLRTLIYRVW